ncbi:MAG: pyridoxal phosphate-dependent aminotransferase [Chloroflexi bacterium]|nr:pyridoxal phosphate-dependent aminotransferase [Chloroflexota bacterium]
MSISRLADSIAESPTLRLNEQARLLRERGEAVIHLGIGEPKNRAPMTAILGAASKLNSGDIKYAPTDGLPSLKKAIIRYTEENYDKCVAPENVIVSAGAKQALFNILYSILNPQEEVVILAPYWVSYPEMVKMCYGVPVIVTPEDGTVRPRFEEVERAITSSTKAIIVNSPNNPSGIIYSDDFVSRIVDLCERKGIYLVMDDIYHKLVFDGKRAARAYQFTQKDIEDSRVIVVNGVAKLYGMTGFRIGWAIAPRRLVQVMTNVQSQVTTCTSPFLQTAAEGALVGPQNIVENLRLAIQNNRDLMLQKLSTLSGVRCARPEGTFYCLPDFAAYERDSVALSNRLLERALVVTVPGREFGMEGHLRLSYAGSVKDVTEGIARIRWALDAKSPDEIYIGDQKRVRDWA